MLLWRPRQKDHEVQTRLGSKTLSTTTSGPMKSFAYLSWIALVLGCLPSGAEDAHQAISKGMLGYLPLKTREYLNHIFQM